VTGTAAPDAAVLRWVQSIPAVRCVAPAFRPWTRTASIDDLDKQIVVTAWVSDRRFAEAAFDVLGLNAIPGFGSMVGHGNRDIHALARVPSVPAIVMEGVHAGGGDVFIAVIAEASSPPHAVATMSKAPRTARGLGLGSPRTAVETALGAARSKMLCGFAVVRYKKPVRVNPEVTSEGEMWFIYRHGVVAAMVRYEAGG
jgi:hypothetical protein